MAIVKSIHEAGIIHRDLTQESIGLRLTNSNETRYKVTKIGGFDHALRPEMVEFVTAQTQSESFEGNFWMAPEVRIGCKQSYSADVWSLG